jgi:outer membrane protein
MKKMIGLLSMTFLLTGVIQAQKKYELTVKEAVELAYKNVIELKNLQTDYYIQEAKNKEIFGQALPQVAANFSGNHYFSLPQIPFPNGTTTTVYSILKAEGVSGANGPITSIPEPTQVPVSFQQPWNLALGATLTQLLFQPDVFVGLQARKAALELSQDAIDQAKERIKDSAYRRYYAILIAQKQLYFLNESVTRLQKLYHDDSIMFKNGFAERLDLDKVQVQLNNLSSTVTTVDNAVTISYAAMKFALGLSQKDTIVLKDDLTVASLRDDILTDTFAYENRAEIRTLNKLEELQMLDLKRYKLGWLPTVSLMGNYGLNGLGLKFFTDNDTYWFNSSYIGINVNLPLFRWLSTQVQDPAGPVQRGESTEQPRAGKAGHRLRAGGNESKSPERPQCPGYPGKKSGTGTESIQQHQAQI